MAVGHAPQVHRRWFIALTIVSVTNPAFFLLANALLHLLRRDFNPATHYISEYAVGKYGLLMSCALVILGIGTLSLAMGIARTMMRTWLVRIGVAILALSGVGTLLTGLFRTTIDGQPATLTGAIHGRAAYVAITCEAVSVLIFTPASFHDRRWHPFRMWSSFLAVAVIISAALYPVLPHGAGERLLVYALVLWLLAAGVMLHSIASHDMYLPERG